MSDRLRAAAQGALEALELAQTDVHWELNSPTRNFLRKKEKALRAALAEPDAEPVAWAYVNTDGECEQIEWETPLDDPSVTPLYTAPHRREWVSLTEEEWTQLHKDWMDNETADSYDLMNSVEAALREKNGG